MSQLVISYSYKDAGFVTGLQCNLEAARLSMWIYHEELSPGTRDWEAAVLAAIKA